MVLVPNVGVNAVGKGDRLFEETPAVDEFDQ
jgi:hypothetical protein